MSMVYLHDERRSPLVIPELFHAVLDCFPLEMCPAERRALSALARTCRAFSEPSLDRLWRKLYSLRPLIRCYTAPGEVENLIPPTPSQLAVIDRYSHRIKELTVFDSASVRFLQCTSMRPSCILPKLTTLHWKPYSRPYIPISLIQRLLSPTLVSLEVDLDEAEGVTILSFFDSYPLLCPDLRSIELRFLNGPYTIATIEAVSRAICRYEMLERVIHHCTVNNTALRHLSTMPTLKRLSIFLSELSTSQTAPFLDPGPLFCNVDSLELKTSNLGFVSSLLRPRDQVFHTLRISHDTQLTPEVVSAFLKSLALRTKPLREFALTSGNLSRDLPVDQVVSAAMRYRLPHETLQPLTVFSSLRVLMIRWGDQISLDDDEIASMARSWPALHTFHIHCGRGGYHPFPSTKYPTLRGLLSLVASCPELRVVSLPLDARHVPEVEDAQPRKTYFTCLALPESPIDRSGPVAEFLCRYLPSVTILDWKFHRLLDMNVTELMAYEKTWSEVQARLEEIHHFSLCNQTLHWEYGR